LDEHRNSVDLTQLGHLTSRLAAVQCDFSTHSACCKSLL